MRENFTIHYTYAIRLNFTHCAVIECHDYVYHHAHPSNTSLARVLRRPSVLRSQNKTIALSY